MVVGKWLCDGHFSWIKLFCLCSVGANAYQLIQIIYYIFLLASKYAEGGGYTYASICAKKLLPFKMVSDH